MQSASGRVRKSSRRKRAAEEADTADPSSPATPKSAKKAKTTPKKGTPGQRTKRRTAARKVALRLPAAIIPVSRPPSLSQSNSSSLTAFNTDSFSWHRFPQPSPGVKDRAVTDDVIADAAVLAGLSR